MKCSQAAAKSDMATKTTFETGGPVANTGVTCAERHGGLFQDTFKSAGTYGQSRCQAALC